VQQIELIHPELGSLKKSVIKERLAKQLKVKEECVTIYGMKSKFGGGRSTGFALIYDNHDLLKKYDSKKELRKVSGDC
jgi:small subunit ribosomal protein S24e